jgi:mercuric ion binding protein
MNTVKNERKPALQPSRRGLWIGLSLAIFVIIGLSYGAVKFAKEAIQTSPAVVTTAGESIVIPVEGLSCSACAARVRKALKETAGVSEAHVSLEKREAEVRYDPSKVSPEKLAKAIDELGYHAGPPHVKEKAQ